MQNSVAIMQVVAGKLVPPKPVTAQLFGLYMALICLHCLTCIATFTACSRCYQSGDPE